MTTPMIERRGIIGPDDMLADEYEEREDDALGRSVSGNDESGSAATHSSTSQNHPIPGGGALLEEPSDAKVFKKVERMVRSHDRLARNREEYGRNWDRVRR